MHHRDFLEISRLLEQHHSIFHKFWNIGKPRFVTDKDKMTVPTAAICFSRKGNFIDFIFNKDFYDKLDNYNRAFVIAHEMLHVIFEHGKRWKHCENKELTNIATDIVINETLTREFGFDKNRLVIAKDGAFVNTVFGKEASMVPVDKNSEYYYNKLINGADKENGWNLKVKSIDVHGYNDGQGDTGDIGDQLVKDMLEQEGMAKDPKNPEKIAGNTPGGYELVLRTKKVRKKKWETVIKNWATFALKESVSDQWVRTNRRFVGLKTELLLPTEADFDSMDREKIQVWFFQDTSGSCADLAERFFKVANSLPEDRFDVRLFCFDTEVYETSLESGKLYGFGGTSFQPMENYIQNKIKQEGIEYPKAVFVVTDGYASDHILPANPSVWHWFLSTEYTECIDKNCKTYDLRNFE